MEDFLLGRHLEIEIIIHEFILKAEIQILIIQPSCSSLLMMVYHILFMQYHDDYELLDFGHSDESWVLMADILIRTHHTNSRRVGANFTHTR